MGGIDRRSEIMGSDGGDGFTVALKHYNLK